MRKLYNTTPLQNDGSLFFGPQHNALASLVHFAPHTTKWSRDASALRWRPERRLPLFCSRVVFLSFFIPALMFLYFLQVHPYLKWSFTETFSLVLFFLGVSKPTFKYNSFHFDITLQTNAFIASDDIVSATHLQIRYHTADEYVYR